MRHNGIVSIQLSTDNAALYYIIREGDGACEEVRRYMELMSDEPKK